MCVIIISAHIQSTSKNEMVVIMNATLNRYERKYLIDPIQKEALLALFKRYLDFDAYSQNESSYRVLNIYYDTHDYSVIRTSIEKPIYKEKLRLRCYDYPLLEESIVYFEIKKKYRSRVNKRRIPMTFAQAKSYITTETKPYFHDYAYAQKMDEIDYLIKTRRAEPKAVVRYARLGMNTKDNGLRVTFDQDIEFTSCFTSFDDLEKTTFSKVLASNQYAILEVKSDQNFPLWLVNELSRLNIYSQPFSKYGKAYMQYLTGGTPNDDLLYHA